MRFINDKQLKNLFRARRTEYFAQIRNAVPLLFGSVIRISQRCFARSAAAYSVPYVVRLNAFARNKEMQVKLRSMQPVRNVLLVKPPPKGMVDVRTFTALTATTIGALSVLKRGVKNASGTIGSNKCCFPFHFWYCFVNNVNMSIFPVWVLI